MRADGQDKNNYKILQIIIDDTSFIFLGTKNYNSQNILYMYQNHTKIMPIKSYFQGISLYSTQYQFKIL